MIALPTVKDHRKSKGKQFHLGLLLFCILLTEFKNCHRQRQRSYWLKGHWEWICSVWYSLTGNKAAQAAPSQSTLSRVLNKVDLWTLKQEFFKLIFEHERANWHGVYSHYSIDGKGRKGILSPSTDRTESDLVIFDVGKNQMMSMDTIKDKQGESTRGTHVLKQLSGKMNPGIITADAAFLTPKFTSGVIASGHQYLIGFKGNGGEAYKICKNLAWSKAPTLEKSYDKGHGRKEIRQLKRMIILPHLSKHFSKYKDSLYLYCLKSTRFVKGKCSTEERFYIGSRGLKNRMPHGALSIIRKHWRQENNFHWVKDKVLDEDNLPKMNNRASRVLSFFKGIAVAVGQSFFQSVQKFVDMFDATPEKVTKQLFALG